jgi:hypothetical protein
VVALLVWVLGVIAVASVSAQQPAPGGPDAPQLAENVFKNVQVLKGIPADEFMDAMGMFAAALLYDCTGCHVDQILVDRSAFAVSTPLIQKARQMVVMVNTLNRTYFSGQRRVTCFTCHRGNGVPDVVPDLRLQYGEVSFDNPNALAIVPEREPSADRVFDTYLETLGGPERLARITSFVASGSYTGFNTGGLEVPIEISARAPEQLATVVRLTQGDAVRVYDGRNAWASEEWRQLPLMSLTGGNLAGARFEAVTWFPAGLQQAYPQWQVGTKVIDDQEFRVLQGANPGELPVNLYFDESGLLVRSMRWTSTPVGTVPTRTDYSDYREVDGVRMPFRLVVTWTTGQNTIVLREVRPNAPIPPDRFSRPAPYRPR